MKQANLVILLLFIFIPLNLQAANVVKEIKIFDFEGNLLNTIAPQGLDWNKVGDIAVADLGNDNIPEIILSAGAGEKPNLKIYRLDGSLINEFSVYPPGYAGGINFEIADLNQDGFNEIITGATSEGGPHVLILNSHGQIINQFFAFEENDRGGINVALGNLYEDSKPEIIISSNSNKQVKIFTKEGKLLNELALNNNFSHGQRIKVTDLGNDGVGEILVYANKDDAPSFFIYQNNGDFIYTYNLYNQDFEGGINLTTNSNQIFIGAGFGAGPHLKIIDGYNNISRQFFTNDEDFKGGVMVAVYDNQIFTVSEQFSTAEKDDQKYILIDLSEQKLRYFEDGFLLGEYLVSSGKPFYETPLGTFSVLNKNKLQYSRKYSLYMPFWMNFYSIYGIHELPYWASGYREGTDHLGKPVSHGCVRLGIGPAEEVYNWAEVGTKVYIEQ